MKILRSDIFYITLVLLLAAAWKCLFLVMDVIPFNSDEAVVALMARHILQATVIVTLCTTTMLDSYSDLLLIGGLLLPTVGRIDCREKIALDKPLPRSLMSLLGAHARVKYGGLFSVGCTLCDDWYPPYTAVLENTPRVAYYNLFNSVRPSEIGLGVLRE